MIEAVANELDEQIDCEALVAHVCRKIPPLWDLRNYVAVNPFLGMAGLRLDAAARILADALDAHALPPLAYYQSRRQDGALLPASLAAAAGRLGQDPQVVAAVLAGQRPAPLRNAHPRRTLAEQFDCAHGGDWQEQLVRSLGRWCAVYVAEGGAGWRRPNLAAGLFASWREAAAVDRSLEIAGLRGWRAWVRALPERPDLARAELLARSPVPAADYEAYLFRLLGRLYGWSCFFRRGDWQRGGDGPGAVAELLTVLLAADAAVPVLAPVAARRIPPRPPQQVEGETLRLVFQEALEDTYLTQLLGKLAAPAAAPPPRPAAQAVFCIDVRSEPLRRGLEAQSPDLETRGFAGFFGVALDWQVGGAASARCPVLLQPAVRLQGAAAAASAAPLLAQLQTAPASALTLVELLGLVYGLRLAADTLPTAAGKLRDGRASFELGPRSDHPGLSLEQRVDLAAAIIKNLGLRTGCAPLVLLCGHEGQSANNPHAAGLDCGACGGHGGALNARVAAALLNDPAVREQLTERGAGLPADTWFLAGVHNTMTDEVTLLDRAGLPAARQAELNELRRWLAEASALVRGERAAALGLDARSSQNLARRLLRRAGDWAEVRPEWGLARNAAFLAARRQRSRRVDLAGRVFLHEYDAAGDPDLSILTLILTAPMVVASWINLQYFASTVDNHTFGCGTKTLHNRVGAAGVVLGNGGDLRTGLPLQSVQGADGPWFHEPLRLQVVVETLPDRIERVLAGQPAVRELVDHGWVRLFALDPGGRATWRRSLGGFWESLAAPHDACPTVAAAEATP